MCRKHWNPWSLEDTILPKVNGCKFLGIYIDSDLNWSNNYKHLTLKLKQNMNVLKLKQNTNVLKAGTKLLSLHAKKTLYYGHIFSHLNYCVSTWGPMISNQQVAKLQKKSKQGCAIN